jgi:hypothetical protein
MYVRAPGFPLGASKSATPPSRLRGGGQALIGHSPKATVSEGAELACRERGVERQPDGSMTTTIAAATPTPNDLRTYVLPTRAVACKASLAASYSKFGSDGPRHFAAERLWICEAILLACNCSRSDGWAPRLMRIRDASFDDEDCLARLGHEDSAGH